MNIHTYIQRESMNIHIYSMHIYMYIYIYDGLSKYLCLVWLINRNSMCAASYLNLKNLTYRNSLKPYILSFIFETEAKTCRKC